MPLILRSVAVSDPGLVRMNNEDAAYAGDRLIAVADGVGGLPAGEIASAIVIRTLAEIEQAPVPDGTLRTLRATLEDANQQIMHTAAADPANEGMSTTVTALLLHGDELGLLHVGDSRAYLLRDGALTQVTRDDTFVQSLVDQGALTPEEARHHPQRSLVTRAVQGQYVAPTCKTLEPHAGDRYLLCSDGLSDVVAEADIAAALRGHPDRHECAGQLVKLALQAGAPDNVTLVIADLLPEGAPADDATARLHGPENTGGFSPQG